jgi:hypothetical protein
MENPSEKAQQVVAAVREYLGDRATWPTSSGYGERIDLALINAVMSIQARFGRKLPDGTFNGVRGAVERYRATQPDLTGDWLQTLAGQEEQALLEILGRGRLRGGKSKAAAIIDGAKVLLDVGFKDRAALLEDPEGAEAAYCSVKGLGPRTFQYFLMLLGADGVKADTWVTRFVSRAVGHKVAASEAYELLIEAAEILGAGRSELDHAVWVYASGTRLRSMLEI